MFLKFWNGEESINGVSADEILSYRDDLKRALENNEKIILVSSTNNGRIESIELENTIRNITNANTEINGDDLLSKYNDHLEQQKINEVTRQINDHDMIISLQERIAKLEDIVSTLI